MSFSPADIFTGGAVGVWIDPSDFSTMYQDTAATMPVTAVGQAIALIKDKSGNGFDFTQSIAANRPTVKKDANGAWYLSFDGSNDTMSCSFGVSLAMPNYACLGGRNRVNPSGTANQFFSGLDTSHNEIVEVADVGSVRWALWGGNAQINYNISADTNAHVVTANFSSGTDAAQIWVDGILGTYFSSSFNSHDIGSQSSSGLRLATNPAQTNFFPIDLFGLVFTDSSFLANRADLETWMGAKIAPLSTKFRRALSPVGGRIGARQAVRW